MPSKKTHEIFIQQMNEKHPEIEVLGYYVNNSTKIKCRCKIDGYEWTPTPHNLLDGGYGCPKCANNIKKNKRAIFKRSI